MFSPSDEPTAVVRILDEFSNRIQSVPTGNRSGSTSGLGHSSSMSAQQRLRFDESALFRSPAADEQPERRFMKRTSSLSSAVAGSRSKSARFDPYLDCESTPLGSSQSNLSSASTVRKRYPSFEEHDALKLELEKAKMELVKMEALHLAAENATKKAEDLVTKMEFNIRAERVVHEERLQHSQMEKRQLTDQVRKLEDEVTELKNKQRIEKEDRMDKRRLSAGLRQRLEDRCSELTDENCRLEERIVELQRELSAFEEEDSEKNAEMKQTLAEAKHNSEAFKELQDFVEKMAQENEQAKQESESLRLELDRANYELARLKEESRSNADSNLQRKAMHAQLSNYPALLEENEQLKRTNQTLVQTAENAQVLLEQIENLEEDLAKSRKEAAEGEQAKQTLVETSKKLREWENASLQLLTPQERLAVGESPIGIDMFRQKVAYCQQEMITCAEEIHSLKARLTENVGKCSGLEAELDTLKKNLAAEKSNLGEFANLVRRLKRKLLLVSKERDSYKGIVDSFDHELTIVGSKYDQDRVAALNKVVDDHKAVIEDLEQQLLAAKSASAGSGAASQQISAVGVVVDAAEVSKLRSDLKSLSERLRKAESERDDIKFELERRAIRGDYNPTDTKVLHFRNNPVSLAQQELSQTHAKLQQENEALKARIRLLEEGQSQDLTLLVGQKVDESKEVADLREKLKSAETARQRVIDAFKTASKDFREACFHLTGYRIDGLQNQQYRLYPMYAESPNDYLLFRRDNNGVFEVLETNFSTQLNELMDLHLRRQNSFPVFCAAVIMELFSRQTFETVASTEEDDDDDDDDDERQEEEEEEEDEDNEGDAAGDDDDPICLD